MAYLSSDVSGNIREGRSHRRYQPSTPIKIPLSATQLPSSLLSPLDRPMSPELIFDMSPISPRFSAISALYPIPESRTRKQDDHDLFLYSVPFMIPKPASPTSPSDSKRAKPTQRRLSDISSASVEFDTCPRSRSDATSSQHQNKFFGRYSDSCGTITKSSSTTKIIGFNPLYEYKPPTPDPLPKSAKPLLPRPRRSSFSSSPWILPGKRDSYEEEVAYSQADPSAFEFRQHLFRRMGNHPR
ncbi:hypothetical protein BJ165DRAFT_1593888 [Panaeolus papilionaceus]|nr:hypothetical protein BJ165DRAFT_1593888 [Panaeolus papilionaceus]